MRKQLLPAIFLLSIASVVISSCQKEAQPPLKDTATVSTSEMDRGHLQQAKTFSSEVVIKWLDLQLRVLQMQPGQNLYGLNASRYFAYFGTALYESVVPGMPAYQTLSGQLTNMPDMPETVPGMGYHWAASSNAALAHMSRKFFPFTTPANKASIDSLENALTDEYMDDVNAETLQRSANFGKAVAQSIFEWSLTDGILVVNPPYIAPTGPGLWAPTPPNFPAAAGPYWGNNRLFVAGSLDNSLPPPPPPYSTDPNSAYYAMVKEVYDISQALTAEQIAIASYYRDAPGYVAGSHYISIFRQLLQAKQPQLDFAALAYAKSGIAAADAFIGCWKVKYQHNIERPIKYIRETLNHPLWNPLFSTPGHPDFPSGHSTLGGAMEATWTSLFGPNFQFTNRTYDYLGMAPRSYTSFAQLAEEIGRSRVYAGIHYSYSCVMGRQQGKTIAGNINDKVKFLKL